MFSSFLSNTDCHTLTVKHTQMATCGHTEIQLLIAQPFCFLTIIQIICLLHQMVHLYLCFFFNIFRKYAHIITKVLIYNINTAHILTFLFVDITNFVSHFCNLLPFAYKGCNNECCDLLLSTGNSAAVCHHTGEGAVCSREPSPCSSERGCHPVPAQHQ